MNEKHIVLDLQGLQPAQRTVVGVVLDWGGTSIKAKWRCPKVGSGRTEISQRFSIT